MVIKSANGESYDVASNGKANAGLTLGIIGTGLAALGGGLGNILGGGNPAANGNYVSKETFELQQSNAAKDMQIAILTAQGDVDKKLVDVYALMNDKVNAVKDELSRRVEAQASVNAAQAVLNGSVNSTIACLQGQIAQIQSLTKVVIPESSVCTSSTSTTA